MSTRRGIFLLVVVLVIGCILFSPVGVVAAEKLVIRFGHHHAVGGQEDLYTNKFADLVSQKSNGNVIVKILPGAQLGQEGEAAEGIHIGSLQTTVASSPFMSKYVKEMGVDYLPFIWESWEHAAKALNGAAGEEMNRRLLAAKSNVRILAWHQIGFRSMLFVKKKVESLEGMKGLKMRSPEMWFFISMFRSLGAQPTPITWGEVYPALQAGVVEGMETPYQAAIDMKFVEVAKHWMETEHMFSNMPHHVNERWYSSLPRETQKILYDSAQEAAAWISAKAKQDEIDVKEKLKNMGCTFAKVDKKPFRDRMKPVYQEWLKRVPEGQSLLDLIAQAR
jgi:tripartite ATP-independent transporter DctP family solute receptor